MNLERLVGASLAGRFQVTQLLAKSRAGADFLATDLTSGEPVLIKAPATSELGPGARMRLEHEATLRRRANSPFLPAVVDSFWDDETFVFVTRRLEGISLAERLREAPLTLPEALTVARCLFAALRELHRHRVLHRDVKPANLIVGEGGIVSAVLAGFGAPEDWSADAPLREQDLETAWYMSPERAGSIDRDVGEPSDLYSAGAVLFHCLAGQPPFPGENLGAVLFEHMTARVPELRSLGLEVPRAMEEAVERLLRKDPRDRYQTAEAVLQDLEALTLAMQRGEQEPNVVIGAHDRRLTLTEPAFVARSRELQVLDDQVALAGAGRGGLVFVEACSGDGKTRLLVELAQRAAREGVWVFRGQASTQVGQRPFRLLEGVVDRFLAAARSDAELVDSVRRKLGSLSEAVCAALPQLRDLLGSDASGALAPEAFAEARTLLALDEFLNSLGDASRPVLLLLDDCQWADELTCKLIGRWQNLEAAKPAEPRYVTVVAAFRSEEASPDHVLRKIRPAAHLQLSPLAADDVRRLAESMAGPLPDEAAQVLIRLSGGSPFMASAVLRGLVESGALSASPSGWRIEPLALNQLQSSSHAASLLARRIELLPPATAGLLSVGAVLGKEFDLKIAAHLSHQSSSEAIDAADEARQRRLVWVGPDGGQCIFVHDKIRAALLDRLSADERRALHRRAALHIQQQAPEQTSDLAYHFDAAGDTHAALPYALQAAETARAQHALQIAEQQYRIAERGAEHADPATRFRIAEGLGDVLMLRGRYDAAAALFEQAASLADGVLANAHIYEKLAELSFKRGDKERATQGFEDALRRLGRFVPRSLPAFALLLLWETIVQVLHTVFPRAFVHRLRFAPSDEVRLQLRLFSRLAHSYWFTRGKVQTLWAHLRGMNLGERYPPTLELAHAYSEHAPAMSLVPLFGRACAYSLRSLEIRRNFGDLWGQGQSLTFYGCVLYYSSRYHESIEKCREAIRLLERMGDYWYVHVARYQLAAALYHVGDFAAAIEECELNYKSGRELRDEQASVIILDVWTRAAGGALPPGVLELERRRELQDPQGAAQILLAEGITLLHAGELRRASESFRQSVAVAQRAGIQNCYTIPSLVWLTTALRLMAERHEACDPQGRIALLRRARRTARRAIRASRICANDLPQALREYALVLAMLGRRRRAFRAFHQALAIAHQHQARSEYAQTLLARGKVGRQVGWPLADRHVAEAEELLGELLPAPQSREAKDSAAEGPVTLSLADRFDTVLGAGRRIASALSKSGIYDEAQSAALRLLRGECCRVVEMESNEDELHASPANGDDDYDLRMISLAERSGRAVAFSEEFAGTTSDHAGSSGEGSALCVPIQVRGRTAACLYVTHRHIRGLFGPDEERLADFIAAIAGAALENAEGFHQLQSLNATLEQRVADRTAAAESRARELALSNEELERVARELRAAEEQLRVAIDAAESANAAKTRFLTTMSHEIRTPMNGILGMTELSLQTPLSPQQRNFLTVIKQSGESLLAILNDVLDLSKIEAGRMELETIPFPVREMVTGAVRLLAVTASRKGVELICRVAPEVPESISGDPTRLRQVIVNLAGNAVKFTSAGDVFVNVYVEHGDEEQLHLAVQDSGIGIPPDKQDSIFRSFQQADNSTTRRYGGTGLGLSISSQLVSLMGGRIWVESELGRGSTFHVVIPLRAVDEMPRPRQPLAGMHILWLSEHPINRGVFRESLASHGAAVTTLGDADDAWAAFDSETAASCYDAIVADLANDDSAGWKLIEKASRRRFPAVVLLSAGQSYPANAANDLSRLHAVSKPASAHELTEAVMAAVRDGDGAAQPQPAGAADDSLPPLRILLAEDGLVNQEVAVGLLEIAGHSVEVANNGREALESLDCGAFDLILMDLEMPEMDGFEATRLIRERESAAREHIPIIAMTAHAVSGFRDRCLEAGMDGYITKPIELKELLRAIQELLPKDQTLAAAE